MLVAKIIVLLLLVHVIGCVGHFPGDETSRILAERERQELKKENAMPTFTYRPGS
jgi:hypothetical protein